MVQFTTIFGALILGFVGYILGKKITSNKKKSVAIGIIVFVVLLFVKLVILA